MAGEVAIFLLLLFRHTESTGKKTAGYLLGDAMIYSQLRDFSLVGDVPPRKD